MADLIGTLAAAKGSLTGSFKADKTISGKMDTPRGDKSFIFTQGTASAEWIVQHNLNKYCSVTVVDSANTVVVGDVIYIDTNNIIIRFSAAFSGKAYLN